MQKKIKISYVSLTLAVEKYKLKLQKKDIQDYSDNKTRFLVIGQNEILSTGRIKLHF